MFVFSPTVIYADPMAVEAVAEEIGKPDRPTTKQSLLDRQKKKVDTQAQRAAQWVDSFFYDSNHEAEVATSQFRIRPELHYREEQGAKARLKFSLKFKLPNIERKVSLVVGNGGEDSDFNDSVDDTTEDTVVGVQFFGKQRKSWHTSLSAGVKFNAFAGFIGPRASFFKTLGEKNSYQFTQTLRYQTNNFWQIISRLDLNRAISARYFFRQTLDGRWRGERSEEEGYRTRLSSLLTRRLENSAGLQYDFTTVFHTRPNTHVDRYTLSVRYRKRTWREWFYYEIAPRFHLRMSLTTRPMPASVYGLNFFSGRIKIPSSVEKNMKTQKIFAGN